MMEIRYVWGTSGLDPNEVCETTLDQTMIPRIGEFVNIEIQLEKEEWLLKSGRVIDLTHNVKREPSVTVVLDT